jgi:hypothetical protein
VGTIKKWGTVFSRDVLVTKTMPSIIRGAQDCAMRSSSNDGASKVIASLAEKTKKIE